MILTESLETDVLFGFLRGKVSKRDFENVLPKDNMESKFNDKFPEKETASRF